MNRFLHKVDKIVVVDGDDVRRAPMAAALMQKYFGNHPLYRLWGTVIESAGAGPLTKEDAHPDAKAQAAMKELSLDISGHTAKQLSLPGEVAQASIVLVMEAKQVKSLRAGVLSEYPSLHSRVVRLLDYAGFPAATFPSLLGAKLPEYQEFAAWIQRLLPVLDEKLRQDTRNPLLAKGVGLSLGEAKGKVRLVKTEEDAAKIEKGDIVVCETNAIKYMFGRGVEAATAIVSTSGSEAHDLSQLGHELNVPCISEAVHAMEILKDGEMVSVHGTAGTVHGEPPTALPKKLSMDDFRKKYGLKPKES